MAQPILFEDFPAEIIDHVLQYLPKDALASLRLASRVFQQRATPFLYRQFTLQYSVASAAKAREIMKRPDLARLVREYTFDVKPSAYFSASDDTSRKVRRVADELPFHRMNSVSLKFGLNMNHYELGDAYALEMFELATYSLRAALSSRSPSPGLYSLSIEKLPCEYQSINHSNISEYLRDLRRLEIGTTTLGINIIDPPNDQTYEEAMGFYARFPRVFLAPASQNLKVLHLSADAPWGWYPRIDLRGIHFPSLESLTLSRFTFTHNWQMHWLSDHARTLKRLSLINCAILCHATCTCRKFDDEGYPRCSEAFIRDGAIRYSFWYKKRWSKYFLGLARFLPRLQSFSLVTPDLATRDTHPQGIPDEEEQACCVADRYLKYKPICYTPTCMEELGEEHKQKLTQMEQDKEDRRYFWLLLEMIRRRNIHQKEDILSVEQLFGWVPPQVLADFGKLVFK